MGSQEVKVGWSVFGGWEGHPLLRRELGASPWSGRCLEHYVGGKGIGPRLAVKVQVGQGHGWSNEMRLGTVG